jgi:glycosyltransferase involved in cell wall biosynthesis
MNYLLSVPLFFPHSFGGGQVYVFRLAKELQRRGHDVNIVTSAIWQNGNDDYKLKNYEYNAIKVTGVELNPEVVAEEDKYSELSPILIKALCDVLKTINPDFVHINGLKPPLITICNQKNIPYVVTAHHPGVTCPASTLLRPDKTLCYKTPSLNACIPCCSIWRVSGFAFGSILCGLIGHIPKWLYHAAGKLSHKRKKISYVIRALRYPLLVEKMMEGDEVILHKSKFIISPSQAMKELLIRNGVAPEKIFMVPHGIDPLPVLPIEPLNDRAIRFGFIGSFSFTKGLHVLINALELVSHQENCELHIYGGFIGQSTNKYLTECLNNYKGKAKIINHGYIPNDNLKDAYKMIDVLVVPSVYFEVFGLVILEAFSAGRPVIVSRSGGPAELVRNGIDGFIVDRNDDKSLAGAMQKFIDTPDLIIEMARQVNEVRTMADHVNELERIYQRLISINKDGRFYKGSLVEKRS